jgi:chloride channel protein, CIC family
MKGFVRLFSILHDRWQQLPAEGRSMIVVALLAVGVGFGAVGFHLLVEHIHEYTIMALESVDKLWFAIGSLACVVGASLLATLIIAKVSPAAAGGGVLPTKRAFWSDFGYMEARTAIAKFLASAITLGGGVSMGPEGPVVQMGAAGMSSAAGVVGVSKQKRRLYCGAGAAAALAAVFNAPLAAIAFVLEEVIGDLSSKLVGGILLASIVGALIAHAVIGPQPAFQIAALKEPTWIGVALCPVVAVVASLGGVAFQKASLVIRGRMKTLKRIPPWARPAVGAVGTWVFGCTAFFITGHTGVFGIGYADVTAVIGGNLGWTTALILAFCKLIATFLAVGTGGCGGIFAPSFFLGAMFGGAIAGLAKLFFPLTDSDVSMLVISGMCAGFVAVIRTPITCILLIFEVTHQFVIVPFLLLATVVSKVVSHKLDNEDLYERMMRQDGEDPHHVLPPHNFRKWREMPVGALATFRPAVATDLSVAGLKTLLAAQRHNCFPVQAGDGTIIGLLPRTEAEHSVATGLPPKLESALWVDAEQTLAQAQHLLIESPSGFLCLGNAEQKRIVGVFTLHDLLRGQEALLDAEDS